MKCEEDFLGVDQAVPRAKRRAVVRFGEPIDLSERLASSGQTRTRQLVPALTSEVEVKLQRILDAMPPGRRLVEPNSGTSSAQEQPMEGIADALTGRTRYNWDGFPIPPT